MKLPSLELPQVVGLWMGMRSLYRTADELFEALRKYGHVRDEEAKEMQRLCDSSFNKGMGETVVSFSRMADLYDQIKRELESELSRIKERAKTQPTGAAETRQA